jgi:hypothetical protein
MGNLKINKAGTEETIVVKLSKELTPIAFNNKVAELIEQGLTTEEAENAVYDMEFVMELYYQKDYGLFLVESELIDYTTIVSPYNGEEYEEA